MNNSKGFNKGDIKILIIAVITFFLVILASHGCSKLASEPGRPVGNGTTTCSACGRKPVYDLGYCKSCYRSFMDFTYGNKD